MQLVVKQEQEELLSAREELLRELDKGIRDMEAGRVYPHEQIMKEICEEFGLVLDV